MAPLNWKKIMDLDLESMDMDMADEISDPLGEFEPGDETDVDRLQKLFQVTKTVMVINKEKGEAMLEMMDKDTKKYEDQIADLEMELKDLKRFGGKGGKDTKFAREEMESLERQVASLEKELNNMQRELQTERQQGERYASRVEDLEKEVSDLKRENELAQDEIRDYRSQIDAVRERMTLRRGEDANYQEIIAKKNRDLIEALDENQLLQDANIQVRNENEELQKKLQEAVTEMKKTASEYIKLKAFVQQSDENIDDVRKENEILKVRVTDLLDKLKMKESSDDEILIAVNEKVEEWKQILQEKEEEVIDYHQQVRRLKEQIAQANIDSDRSSIAVLNKAVEERDRQIRAQQQDIEQARIDLESTARVIESLRKQLQESGKGPSDRQVLQIKELNQKLADTRERLADAESNMRRAEDDAADKDKALNDALERMHQYEMGEYGLKEAVDEIKALKMQVGVRDRQIGEMTQMINKAEMKINDLSDENEQLRAKLGIEADVSIDIEAFKREKNEMKQQDRALNQILQKEIEALEEERVELKKANRILAKKAGQRAAALGITEEFDLVPMGTMGTRSRKKSLMDNVIEEEVTPEVNVQLQREVDKNSKKLERAHTEVEALKKTNESLLEENHRLQAGFEEVISQIKEGKVSTDAPLDCPTLEKLVAVMETKRVGGDNDAVVYQKARADNLEGRVDELRKELRESRSEHSAMQLEVSKLQNTVDKLQAEVEAAKDPLLMNRGATAAPLPKTMTATSSEIVASVNECLINVIQDVHLKEELLKEMTDKLEVYKRKFAVVRHQLGCVYQDYLNERSEWDGEKKDLEKKLADVDDAAAVKDTRLIEFDRLLDTLSQSGDEIKVRLAEESRRIAVARVNETNLTRRYNALMDIEATTRRENNKLKSELVDMELTVTERIGYLLRYKDMAAFKIEHLHKELENSVPFSELDTLSKKHCEMTEKYRDLLEKGNLLIAKKEELRAQEVENEELKRFNEELKKMLEIEKEKCHVLESRLEADDGGGHGQLTDKQASSISKKLTMLEMKELNERQRAEHAQRMFDQIRSTNRVLEARNTEVEQKFSELTETVMQSQRTEQELRDQLDHTVSKDENERQRVKLLQLETNDKHLRDEIAKLKQITEVSLLQASCLDAQQVSRDKENLSLRQQLLDIQQCSDEKTIIGKLHRQIVRLQVSEGTAVRKYEQAKKRILSLEAHVLKLEEVIDEKEETFSHKQSEHRANVKNLKRTIQSLRENFSGALPLRQVERMSKTTAEMQASRAQLQADVKNMQDEKSRAEDKVAEIQLRNDGLNELLVTFQDGAGAQKVTEWHQKMEALRLDELKHKRLINKLKQKCKYLEEMAADNEKTIQSLEEESLKQTREIEERQIVWEQREVKLEEKIEQLEKNQAKITHVAASFTAISDALPNPNVPVAEQLDAAVTTIKKNLKTMLDLQSENKDYKQKNVDLSENVRRLEREILTKERIIAELRLRMPATSDRNEVIRKIVDTVTSEDDPGDPMKNAALKMAESTISSLQARLIQKEETFVKYQELLRQAREDMTAANHRHEQEMQVIQEKLRLHSESSISRFRQMSEEIINQPTSVNKRQAAKLRELADIVCDQENTMEALAQKVKVRNKEVLQWQRKYDELMVLSEQEKNDLIEASKKLEADFNEVQTKQENQIRELTEQVTELEKQLQLQKSMYERAPTAHMQRTVTQLKNQLEAKTKQTAALNEAVKELRSEMLQQAEACAVSAQQSDKSQGNVQKLISKQTAHLQEQLEEAKADLAKLNKTLGRHQQSEAELKRKISDLENNCKKRERQLQQLHADKHKLEQDNLELDNKVQRLKSSRLGKTTGLADSNKTELDRLRRAVATLESELKRKRDEAEKPYEQQAVTRWEENKTMQKNVEQMKNRLRERDSEIADLKKQLDLTKKALITANKDKQTLQNRLKAKESSTVSDADNILRQSVTHAQSTPFDLDSSDADAVAKIRKLQQENAELRFESETFRKDVPRLKSRIQDLHNYIEVLRTENGDLKGTSRSLSGTGTSGASSGLRRLGESGKSTRELEKTIMLLKKVIERLKIENDRLKKSPGVLRNDDVEALQLENEGLKNQLSELREKFGASLSNRYESSQKGIAKMRDEYDKIRKDLRKEVDVNQKLSMENRHLQVENEQLKTELTMANSRLEIKEGPQKLSEWSSSNISGKVLEDRVKNLLVDNNKQSELIEHMKELLKDSASREQQLKYENDTFRQKLKGKIPAKDVTKENPLASDQGIDGLLHQVVELQLENKQLYLEKSRLQDDIIKLKKQSEMTIDNEQIERLKFAYEQVVLKNEEYERKIAQVEVQFGIQLN